LINSVAAETDNIGGGVNVDVIVVLTLWLVQVAASEQGALCLDQQRRGIFGSAVDIRSMD